MNRPHDASIAHGALPGWRRLLRRRTASAEAVAAHYAGLVVFDRCEQPATGRTLAHDFPRVLNELGVGRCGRLFQFCAGPGSIGYALLANGWCETLALSDVDAGAIAIAMRTAAYNGIEHRVAGYVADVLDDIPACERWDLVVANPPAFDPSWTLRRRFYASIKTHMTPGGVVVMAERLRASDPDLFAQMIRAGGGVPDIVHVGTDVHGRANGVSYQLSVW